MAYQKQIWENLPSTNTPVNADRLNHMEDGIYDASTQIVNAHSTSTDKAYSASYINGLKKVIYENQGTSVTDIVCSEAISNFDFLEIEFYHQDYYSSMIVPTSQNDIQIMSMGIPSGNTVLQFINQRYTINGSTLEFVVCAMVNISNTAVSFQDFYINSATIQVKKITGIKLS